MLKVMFSPKIHYRPDHHKNGTDCLPVWHAMH